MQTPIDRVTVSRPFGSISAFEAGAKTDLPALVLLPGLTCSAERFITDMLPLARRTKLVAIEWRGHGDSTAPSDSWRSCVQLRDLATDVLFVLRSRLQGSKLCLLGHSMGARVLWSMLENFESELKPVLEAVAIVDQDPRQSIGLTSAGPHDSAHAEHKRACADLGRSQTQMTKALQQLFSVEGGFAHCPAVFSEWLAFASRVQHSAVASLHWEAMTSDFCHVVNGMTTRVLAIAGDATIAAAGAPDRLSRAIPPHGAHVMIIPGGSHLIFQQPELRPELFRLILRLLDGSLEINAPPWIPPQIPRKVVAASASLWAWWRASNAEVLVNAKVPAADEGSESGTDEGNGTSSCTSSEGSESETDEDP